LCGSTKGGIPKVEATDGDTTAATDVEDEEVEPGIGLVGRPTEVDDPTDVEVFNIGEALLVLDIPRPRDDAMDRSTIAAFPPTCRFPV
jgi:hypothetical protein